MATKSKTTAKKTTVKKTNGKKTATKKSAAPRAAKSGKSSQVIALMRRASGVTREEVLALTKWKAVSMQQLATAAGVKLKVDESKRPFTYRAAQRGVVALSNGALVQF